MFKKLLFGVFFSATLFCGGDHEELAQSFFELFTQKSENSNKILVDSAFAEKLLLAAGEVNALLYVTYLQQAQERCDQEVLALQVYNRLEQDCRDQNSNVYKKVSALLDACFASNTENPNLFLKDLIKRIAPLWMAGNCNQFTALPVIVLQKNLLTKCFKDPEKDFSNLIKEVCKILEQRGFGPASCLERCALRNDFSKKPCMSKSCFCCFLKGCAQVAIVCYVICAALIVSNVLNRGSLARDRLID